MSLTVPRAGSDGGRAARVRVEPSSNGAALAEFGQRVQSTFEAVENFQIDTQLQKAETDATRQLNDLRLEVEQIGDPRAAEQHWKTGSAAIREGYTGEASELPGKVRDRFGNAFDRMSNAHAYSLGRRFIRDSMAAREASYIDWAHSATRIAASAEPEVRSELIAQGEAQIEGLLRANAISPDEAARRRIGLRTDIDNARAIEMVQADPTGFLEASGDPEAFPGLTAEQLSAKRAQAQRAVDAGTAAAVRQAKVDAAAVQRAIGKEINDAVNVLKSGKAYGDTDFLNDPATKAHENYGELAVWLDLQTELPTLQKLSPVDLKAYIEKERSTPATDDFEADRLAALESYYDEAVTGYQTDPIAYGQKQGLSIPSLPEFDPSDAEGFANALTVRVAIAEAMRQDGWTDHTVVFSRKDREAIARANREDADPAARVELARVAATVQTADGRYPLRDAMDDPVMDAVGGLVHATGDTALATEILTGQAQIRSGNITMPTRAERLDPATGTLETLLSDLPGGPKIERQIREAADALYAARIKKTDEVASGDIDDDVYRQALHEVMGGTGPYDEDGAAGGVQDVRQRATILPVGIRASAVDGALDHLGRISAGKDRGKAITELDQATFETQMRAISGGRLPAIGGETLAPEDLQASGIGIQAIGDDRYVFIRETRNSQTGYRTIYADDGAPFVFSLRRLVREVGR